MERILAPFWAPSPLCLLLWSNLKNIHLVHTISIISIHKLKRMYCTQCGIHWNRISIVAKKCSIMCITKNLTHTSRKGTIVQSLWSTDTSMIRHVTVSNMCQIGVQKKYFSFTPTLLRSVAITYKIPIQPVTVKCVKRIIILFASSLLRHIYMY
jgi:hypothetical protein